MGEGAYSRLGANKLLLPSGLARVPVWELNRINTVVGPLIVTENMLTSILFFLLEHVEFG